METTRPLVEISRNDLETAGSKAAALGELLRAGFNVPPGVVLTTEAYFRAIAGLEGRIDEFLTPAVLEDPGELEPAAARVREWIVQEPWDPEWSEELADALALLHSDPFPDSFAARTSLPSEELASAFGAGVERAALGLPDREQVQRGVAACWSALWTSRSMYYRYRKKIRQTSVALAVLVQPMVPAQSAGVLFTRNPSTGDPSEMVIDSIWGLGAPVTQARVRPDRFTVSRKELTVLDRQVQEKTVSLVLGESGQVEQRAVEADLIDAPSLSDEQAAMLARLGIEIERRMDGAQTVEWALAGGDFFILQAAPSVMRQS